MDASGLAVRAQAGNAGGDVRGDCRVSAWRDGKPSIEIRSRVQSMYGHALRQQCTEVLTCLDALDVSLLVEDEGALPYVIGARIEAAVKRLDSSRAGSWLPAKRSEPSDDARSLRTRLYLPGNTPKFFLNACLYGADALILDLEDSVAPSEKDAALILVRNALLAMEFRGARKMVRIERGDAGLRQAAELQAHGVETLILPKAETAEEVQSLAKASGPAKVIPLIETARGVANALPIAQADAKVVALSIGLEDYLADLGATRSADGAESSWAYSQIINAARAARVAALGPVFSNFADLDALTDGAKRLAGLGFDGFSCIHPSQIAVIHSALKPSSEAVAAAERTLEAYRAALASGSGAVSVDGKMVDAPVAAQAERVLRLSGRSA